MPFKFKMQKVLDYRELLEEQAKMNLAKILKMLLEEQAKIKTIQGLIFDNEKQLYNEPFNNSGERWILELFIKGLKEDLTASALRIRSLNETYYAAQKTLIFHAKEKKILDKYKSNQLKQHNKNESLKEQRDNDETATIRYKVRSF